MIASIIVIAVGTYLTRVLPFIVLKKDSLPHKLERVVDLLPYATISLLVVYSLKDTHQSTLIPTILALILLTGIHLWKRNTILTILVSTAFYMLCVQIGF